MPADAVRVTYTNWRGETRLRLLRPERIWFGRNQWHPAMQWLMDATDLESGEERCFAMKDLREWTPATGGPSDA